MKTILDTTNFLNWAFTVYNLCFSNLCSIHDGSDSSIIYNAKTANNAPRKDAVINMGECSVKLCDMHRTRLLYFVWDSGHGITLL